MGKIREHSPVKLFVAVTTADLEIWEKICAILKAEYSPFDSSSGWYDFSFTDYYTEEMGPKLRKQVVSFEKLISPEALPEIKLFTNILEEDNAVLGKRCINLDPGYLEAAKVVLATTKDYSHRVFLEKGIYGDVHLTFRGDHFRNNPWTYPDYQQELIHEYFEKVRKLYMKQLKKVEGYRNI